MLLNKNNKKDHLAYKSKVIPFDGFEVKIIRMGISDLLAVEKLNVGKGATEELIVGLLMRCCVDEENKPIFEEEDIKMLPVDVARVLFEECFNFNMNIDIEDTGKNS